MIQTLAILVGLTLIALAVVWVGWRLVDAVEQMTTRVPGNQVRFIAAPPPAEQKRSRTKSPIKPEDRRLEA